MNQVAQYIFFFLIGTTVLNFIIAVAARTKTGNREYNFLVFYWITLFINFVCIAVFSESVNEIALSYFFTGPPTILIGKMLRDSRNIKSNWPLIIGIELAGMAVSAFLLLNTDLGFSYSLFPFIFSASWFWIYPIYDALLKQRHESNWIEKAMAILFITGILSHFAFAFYRLDESAAWWGWAQSIAHYQCFSVFLPLLINHRRERNERKNLESALERMTGKHTKTNTVEINELYRALELQIGQKEEFSRQVSRMNAILEEEREMNEILIKTISHDLANPLTVINAYMEMIASGRIAEKDQEKIQERIRLNLNSAMDMIARIRTTILSRSEAEIVNVVPVDLKNAIQRMETLFETHLREKNLTLNITGDLTGLRVLADENALVEHVFANVLSNAVKFSFAGSEILIQLRSDHESVSVEFRDYGVGISPDRIEKLTSTRGTHGEEGTGFGLIVMGYFLRKFGADLRIISHSQDGQKGTSFTVVLKRALENAPQKNHVIF